ncbi:MAG: MFS transporter [Cyanobacteria bacterium]|nr:MFS transporter [Cyanobacteriota bacterium]
MAQALLDNQQHDQKIQPRVWNFWRLLALSIGFLGIQFGWAIQMGQMSPLLERLGSDPRLTGLISCAGPVTGVFVQPMIGALSDRCTSRWGRRRPFLLLGICLTALSLVFMPHSSSLLMAAVLLWILDASLNITQGPYRALVPDVVPKQQQAAAYAYMSATIGLGSVIAFWVSSQLTQLDTLFNLGAMAILLAMGATILLTPETPVIQENSEKKEAAPNMFKLLWRSIVVDPLTTFNALPQDAKKLCFMHSMTWFGLMCLFVYVSVFIPHQIFGAKTPQDPGYQTGVQWVSQCYAVFNIVCFVFSMAIGPLVRRFSKKWVHTLGLTCLSGGLLGLWFAPTPMWAMALMGLMGIGWATTLSVPFALLSDYLPGGKEGVLMGTFNIFIAAPGVLSNLLVGQLIALYDNQTGVAMLVGGVMVLASALMLQSIREKPSLTLS